MTIQWLAGFFDGEGNIYLTKYYPYHKCHELRVNVSQKNLRILKEVVAFLGFGKIYSYSYKTALVSFTNRKAYKLLKMMLPYLMVKLLPAKFAIQYWENKKTDRRSPSEKEVHWREMHYQLLKLYNQGGYSETLSCSRV